MAEITIYEVNATIKWLEDMERSAKRKSQKEHEEAAKLAVKVVKSLSGTS